MFKKLVSVLLFGDTKRPPLYDGVELHSTIDYVCHRNTHTKYSVTIFYDVEGVHVEAYWDQLWHVTIVSLTEGSLKYDTKYMDAIPELKEVIDFLCFSVEKEYRKTKQLEVLAKIRKEVNIFPKLLSKIRGETCSKE